MPHSRLFFMALLCAGITACGYTDCDQAAFALRDCWNSVAECSALPQSCTLPGAGCQTSADCPMDSQNWTCTSGTCVTRQQAPALCLAYKNGDPMIGGAMTTNASANDRPDCGGSYGALARSILSCTMAVRCQTAADCPRDSRTWTCKNYYCNAITPATCCMCPAAG